MNSWMAKRSPRIAKIAVKNIMLSAKLKTKCNYFSCLRSCFAFMYESGLDPSNKYHYKPEVIVFWLIYQADRLGNCNAWSTWISSMTWWLKCIGAPLDFLDSTFYKEQRKAIKSLYTKERRKRLPMRIEFLEIWLEKMNINENTWDTININLLMEAIFYVVDLFSISRPGELLWSDNTEFPEWEIITTGLKWCDIEQKGESLNYMKRYIILTIEHYKNKAYFDTPKLIPMAAPTCYNKGCKCKNLDFIAMLGIYKKRRRNLVKKLCKQLEKSNLKHKKLRDLHTQIENLKTSPENYVFVSSKGIVFETRHISNCMKKMVRKIGLQTPKLYTNYSWRSM